MKTYDLYGSKLSLVEAKNILQELLSLNFEIKNSEYKGGEYFYAGNRLGEDFEVRQNIDPYDGEPAEI